MNRPAHGWWRVTRSDGTGFWRRWVWTLEGWDYEDREDWE
jgi:hypothetical protein